MIEGTTGRQQMSFLLGEDICKVVIFSRNEFSEDLCISGRWRRNLG